MGEEQYASLDDAKGDLELLCDVFGVQPKIGKHKCPFHDDHDPSLSIWERSGIYFWRCMSRGCGKGTIVDAIALKEGISPETAIHRLCPSSGSGQPHSFCAYRKAHRRQQEEPLPPIPRALRVDATLHAIEQAEYEPEAFARRGIPKYVAERFGVAFFREIVFRGRNRDFGLFHSWLMPITDAAGEPKAIKIHRDVRLHNEDKCGWLPVGQQSHGYATLWPPPETWDTDGLPFSLSDWPQVWQDAFERGRNDSYYSGVLEDFEVEEIVERRIRERKRQQSPVRPEGWLVICPGELKALAVIGSGYHATSITAGESHRWTPGQIKRLAGRRVIILYDDDGAGRRFRDATVEALKCHVPELRAVTLGAKDGEKVDANDVARESPSALKEALVRLIASAPDLTEKPFDIATHRVELAAKVKEAVDGDEKAVHLFASIVGAGKSRAVIEAVNASEKRFVIFAASHALAQEYEQGIPGSLRVLSPDRMTKEGILECPSLPDIGMLREKSLPYPQRVCAHCKKKEQCRSFQQRDELKETRVLILQHAHLKLIDQKESYTQDRVRIIDESCLHTGLRWRVEFKSSDLDEFDGLLLGFRRANPDKFAREIERLRGFIADLRGMRDGTSQAPQVVGVLDVFQYAFNSWLGKSELVCRNLLLPLSHALRPGSWIRRSDGVYSMVQESLLGTDHPLLVLDATAKPETYRAIFGQRPVLRWPDKALPTPQSEVIQFVDGLFPQSSLLEGDQPRKSFHSIMEHVRAFIDARAIPYESVGIITLKKLKLAVKEALPGLRTKNILNYGALRGVNILKDCRLVVLIGCQPPKDRDLAVMATTLFKVDADPESLLPKDRRRKFKPLLTDSGDGYEVSTLEMMDERLALAWDMSVTSEIVQAIGRARPYEKRIERQTVLVFSNQPLPCPVTRAMTRKEHLMELSGTKAEDRTSRIADAMKQLGEGFTLADLAGKLGIAESTLNNARWREDIKVAADAVGLEYQRLGAASDGGRGSQPGRFVRRVSNSTPESVTSHDPVPIILPLGFSSLSDEDIEEICRWKVDDEYAPLHGVAAGVHPDDDVVDDGLS